MKSGRYFKYAIGEIVLVVIGILIALSINNWNQKRLIKQERVELIKSLIDDMSTTVTRMDSAIVFMQDYLDNGAILMKIAPDGAQGTSLDSIRALFIGSFGLVTIHPELTTYSQAVNAGKIGLIKSPEVLKYFTEIIVQKERYDRHVNIGANGFYMGPFWELKKQLGDVRVIYSEMDDYAEISDKYKLTEEEFRTFIAKREVFALIQNEHTLNQNLMTAFTEMRSSAESIITTLGGILTD